MRVILGLAALLALGACGSDVPSPAERLQQENGAAPVDAGKVVLRGDGLAAGAEAFYFAAGRSEVETAMGAVLGPPEGRQSNEECGAGLMEFTRYEGGLTLNFQQDRLVGWYSDEANPAIALDGGGSVGTPRAELAEAGGFSMIEGSTLGEEFALGERIGGFLDGDTVSGLYAGANCFFR
ncbi:hypothetical protein [Erythrobacter litoralis]|uniref:Aspartate-semialdehyde dehydrogenase n=1 Tax=Erythrobacter litoralis (strain HTCC2594) TaxID=314225 RepID=Q2N9R4_ERYLH|nr:hypothetical protein [Erythrobacter litoralis]ABC63577.1 hypothetical protein ELI_07425 [Erythrobacter litoralis HTCC2594]